MNIASRWWTFERNFKKPPHPYQKEKVFWVTPSVSTRPCINLICTGLVFKGFVNVYECHGDRSVLNCTHPPVFKAISTDKDIVTQVTHQRISGRHMPKFKYIRLITGSSPSLLSEDLPYIASVVICRGSAPQLSRARSGKIKSTHTLLLICCSIQNQTLKLTSRHSCYVCLCYRHLWLQCITAL